MISTLFAIEARVAVLFALCLFARLILRRKSAATRRALWVTLLTVAIVVPVFVQFAPPAKIPFSDSKPVSWIVEQHARSIAPGKSDTSYAPSLAAPIYSLSDDSAEPITIDRAGGCFALGALAILVFAVIELRRVRVLLLGSRASPSEHVNTCLRLSTELGVKRSPDLRTSPLVSIPFTVGVLRSRIVLPEAAISWREDKLEIVLRHELAHVRRHDAFFLLVARFACAIHWFNPLVWWANAQFRLECERAADDIALSGPMRPSQYAAELLSWSHSPAAPAMCIPIVRHSSLAKRLLNVLNANIDRRGTSTQMQIGLLVVILGAAYTVSALVEPPGAGRFPLAGGGYVQFEYCLSRARDGSIYAWDLRGRPIREIDPKVLAGFKSSRQFTRSPSKRPIGFVFDMKVAHPPAYGSFGEMRVDGGELTLSYTLNPKDMSQGMLIVVEVGDLERTNLRVQLAPGPTVLYGEERINSHGPLDFQALPNGTRPPQTGDPEFLGKPMNVRWFRWTYPKDWKTGSYQGEVFRKNKKLDFPGEGSSFDSPFCYLAIESKEGMPDSLRVMSNGPMQWFVFRNIPLMPEGERKGL